MFEPLQDKAVKGRGAVTNRAGRYERESRYAVDDGWGSAGDEDAPPLRTHVQADASRSLVAKNDSPDIGFDFSINPYRGCEHGCIYCFARPSHAWLGLSPGLDFETRLFAKHDAAALLRTYFAKRNYSAAPIAIGANTDPYQPVERRHEITRRIIEVMAEHRHPFNIITKSAGVLRDLDLLGPLGEQGLVKVHVSVTTLDPVLARRMEPRASAPHRRFEAIRGLAQAGVPVGVLAAPMIPALNDAELDAILETCREAGASEAAYILIRLPMEIRDLFIEWLEEHYPDRAKRVIGLIRDTRGGKHYDSAWGTRMTGTGTYAELLRQRFHKAIRRLGLNERNHQLRTDLFVPPEKSRTDDKQLALF